MTFYNILWIAIFALGGISLGLFGFLELNYFTILIVNPSMFNNLIRKTEKVYQSATSLSVPDNMIPVLNNNRIG